MSIELQVATGLLTGVFIGLALGLLRPLLALAVGAMAAYLVVCLALDGPPAIAAALGRAGRLFAAYPVFFSTMAAAKALGCVLALRR